MKKKLTLDAKCRDKRLYANDDISLIMNNFSIHACFFLTQINSIAVICLFVLKYSFTETEVKGTGMQLSACFF